MVPFHPLPPLRPASTNLPDVLAYQFVSKAWTHPKITPFRLAFFLITGALGIAKAILVSKGLTASSTTVEWVTGVVVALMWVILQDLQDNDVHSMLRCGCNLYSDSSS